jgi:hypothetical protein
MVQIAKPPKTPLRSLKEAVARIKERWGIERKPKTLRNDICDGRLPAVYVGVRPFMTDDDIDRYAQSLISPISPRRRARLRRGEGATM